VAGSSVHPRAAARKKSRSMVALAGVVFIGVTAACKSEQQKEVIARDQQAVDALRQGRTALAAQRFAEAIDWFKKSLVEHPDEVSTHLLLAEAYRRSGDPTVALLTLQEAKRLTGQEDPSLSRALIDLYVETKAPNDAIAELKKLQGADLLTELELLELTRLLARQGRTEEAFQVLASIQARAPDDVEAKVVEAEVLISSGSDLLAGKLMDRLVQENASMTSVRVLRAKFFISKGRPELAHEELEAVQTVDMRRADVVALRVQSLNGSGEYEKAEKLLTELVEIDADDVSSQSLLAETQYEGKKFEEAKATVDGVLSKSPLDARSLTVRAKLENLAKREDAAAESVGTALLASPDFPPALSLSWQFQKRAGKVLKAIETLQRLVFLNEASQTEKLELAGLYLEARTQPERAKKLVDEVLETDAKNAVALALKKQMGRSGRTQKTQKASTGIQIIRPGRRR
jgi:tetratricopeptide (TPR) repeat protein